MDTAYNTRFAIRLIPQGQIKPIITYGLNQDIINTIVLDTGFTAYFDIDLPVGKNSFYMEFSNKTDDTPDMAIEIESVTIEDLTLDRFKYEGIYYPDYPKVWASTQTDLPTERKASTYLGWNGRWVLPFTVPIFTWIHQVENLGWIYK